MPGLVSMASAVTVGMDDPNSPASFGVRCVQRIRDLDSPFHKLFGPDRAPLDALSQRHPFQAFHRNERLAVFLTDVIYRADIWVVQARRCPRLTLEALQRLPIVREFFR